MNGHEFVDWSVVDYLIFIVGSAIVCPLAGWIGWKFGLRVHGKW